MELHDLLKYVVEAFEDLGVDYIVTGSIASIYYGEPRFTNDIDIVADIRQNHVKSLIEKFPAESFYLSEEAAQDAIARRSQFNIIHPFSGLKVDVIVMKDDAFNKSRFARKIRISPLEGTLANLAAPEDVIIMKMSYYREGESGKHLRDIAGILKISGDSVDISYIEHWASQLGLAKIWKTILTGVQDEK